MWGAKLFLVLLTCVYPDPVAESWSLFGTANESECGVNATCEEGKVRGVFSRPGFLDNIAERASTGQWGWLAKFAWRFIGEIFVQGIAWCGTLCNFVGIAASWSYWLMVGVVVVFLLQLGVWTVTWILLPLAQHSYALVQYLRGRAPWHEVASLHGLSTFRPSWVGPRAGIEWTSGYIQQDVRGLAGSSRRSCGCSGECLGAVAVLSGARERSNLQVHVTKILRRNRRRMSEKFVRQREWHC